MLPTEKVFDDPAVFWDDEHEAGLSDLQYRQKAGGRTATKPGNENYIFKMSWDGREILDEGTLVYTGRRGRGRQDLQDRRHAGTSSWPNGFAPTRGSRTIPRPTRATASRSCLRSKTDSIYGPYEKKVVFERGNGVIRSCSQGGLMQAPDGSWWYTHQLIQNIPAPFQGRPQCLEPVEWIDGWPMIGKDVDGDGIGEPVLHHAKPIHGLSGHRPADRRRVRLAGTRATSGSGTTIRATRTGR